MNRGLQCLRESTMVHVSHSFISNAIGGLFNKLSIPSASMPEVIEMIACSSSM